MYHKYLGINNLVFIDTEPGDKTGHIDGTARFLDETTLAVAAYPAMYKLENKRLDDNEAYLAEKLGPAFTIFRIPNGPIEMRKTEGIDSARGNHLNFLRVGKYLFLPCYGDNEDEEARIEINTHQSGIKVVPVGGENVIELSRFGGVFNCISWGI